MRIPFQKMSSIVALVIVTVACGQTAKYDVALKNVAIYDTETHAVLSHKTILINGDTIASIVDAAARVFAKEEIEGKGRLVTAGFIDTHTHILQNYKTSEREWLDSIPKKDHEMVRNLYKYRYLNQGVTTIIDMGQPEEFIDLTIDWQQNPTAAYPNMYISGGSIVSDDDYRQPQHHIEVMNPEDGRKKVREYAAKGIKHMKLYRKLRKDDMKAMVDEAQKQEIIISTHTDNNVVTIQEAMGFGIQNFEHFFTVIPSVLRYDVDWDKMNAKYNLPEARSIDNFSAAMMYFFSYIREEPLLDAKLEALFEEMASNGATISTALNVLASSLEATERFTSFEHFPVRKGPLVDFNEAQRAQLKQAFDAMLYYMKMAHDKGVKIRIGTDSRYGGLALIEELMLFHRAGISTQDIIEIATYNGYDAMGLTDNWGSIAVGKKADLVLFDKSPFTNAENFRSTKTVLKDGKIQEKSYSLAFDLQDEMVANGLEAAKKWFSSKKGDAKYTGLQEPELRMIVKEYFTSKAIPETAYLLSLYNERFPNGEISYGAYIVVNVTYALLSDGKFDQAIESYDLTKKYFPKDAKTLPLEVTISILRDGIAAGRDRYNSLKNTDIIFEEGELNYGAYQVMNGGKLEEAITLFTINTEAYPESWNAFDSLGEAHAKAGNKTLAIQNYQKSIALNPENTVGKQALKTLLKE